MLSFLRGKYAQPVIFGFTALGLVGMLASGGGSVSGGMATLTGLFGGGDNIAQVGKELVGQAEVRQQVQARLEGARQQQPELTAKDFIAAGALTGVIDAIINQRSLIGFGDAHGMAVSKRAIDSDIFQRNEFKGLTGQFDQARFQSVLNQNHLTEAQVRGQIGQQMLSQQMMVPIAGAVQMPKSFITAYAGLLTEMREGKVGIIPAAALLKKTSKPSEAQISAFYAGHAPLYTLPERRVIDYVVYDKAQVASGAKPSDAEITAYYNAHSSDYTAKDMRSFTQVIASDEATARKIAAQASRGLGAAAKAAGLEATAIPKQDKAAFTGLTSQAVADAGFGGAAGHVFVGKSQLGWHVVHIDSVQHESGKTLAQAHDSISKILIPNKVEDAFASFQNRVTDKVTAGGHFEDVVKENGGTIISTPLITANGVSPDHPEYRPVQDMVPLVKDAFRPDVKANSAPQFVSYGFMKGPSGAPVPNKDRLAFYRVRSVVVAGPVPLARIHDKVAQDQHMDAAQKQAHLAADAVTAKLNKGMPFAQAMTEAGLSAAQIAPVNQSQVMLQQSKRPIPAPLRALFSVAPRKAKAVEADSHNGWFVVWLDKTTPVDPNKIPQLMGQMQQQLGGHYGQELAESFENAAQSAVGVKRYPANIKALSAALSGHENP